MLPPPDQESLFLQELTNQLSSNDDPQTILESLIREAIQERRPQLAGQLFTLLPNQHSTDPVLQKAQQALRLMLIEAPAEPTEAYWEDVQEQWALIEFTRPGHRLRNRHHPRAQQDPRSQYGTRAWRRRR